MSVRCLLLRCFVAACLRLFAACLHLFVCFQAYTSSYVLSIQFNKGSCVCLVPCFDCSVFACFLFAT